MTYNDVLETAIPQFTDEGREVVLQVMGRSMLPFIVGSRDSVVLVKITHTPRVGDIVLAKTRESGYVIHRVDSISEKGTYALLGDGNLKWREHCKLDDIHALAIAVILPGGRRRSLQYGFWAKVWRKLLPVRRYLLWIYKKTHKQYET